MDPWVWLAAYLLGFGLLQVLLYRYFRREIPRGEATTPASVEHPGPRAAAGGEVGEETGARCPHCGADNEPDPAYTFCRECLSPLS